MRPKNSIFLVATTSCAVRDATLTIVGVSGRGAHFALLPVRRSQNMTCLLAKAVTKILLSGDQLTLETLLMNDCRSRSAGVCGLQQITLPLFAPAASHIPSGDQRSVVRLSHRMLLLSGGAVYRDESCACVGCVDRSWTNNSLSIHAAKSPVDDQSNP
jgi:hypothetical protein